MEQTSFPLFGLLGLLFIGLKLAGVGVVASWSWWLVLLPFYGPLALVVTILLFAWTLTVVLNKL